MSTLYVKSGKEVIVMQLRKIYKPVLVVLTCGLVLLFALPSFETGNPHGMTAVVITLLGLAYMTFHYTTLNDWPSHNFRAPAKWSAWTVLFGFSAWVLSWSTVPSVLFLRDIIAYITAGAFLLTLWLWASWFQDWRKYGIH